LLDNIRGYVCFFLRRGPGIYPAGVPFMVLADIVFDTIRKAHDDDDIIMIYEGFHLLARGFRKEAGKTGAFNREIGIHDVEFMGDLADFVLAQNGKGGVPFAPQGLKGGKTQDYIPKRPLMND